MTCNILVLFANDSEKLAMELISQFDHVPINYICVSNHSLQLSNMQQKTQAKIHIVFFSPDFLRFLENRVLDAYHMCGHLESKSSIAVFCHGLRVENVLCYHMAPLRSFPSWDKYELLSGSSKNHVFPQELMSRILEVLRQVNFAAEDIVVVPQFLKRHNSTVYVIFPSPIEACTDLYISLLEHEEIDISLEKMNPYVIKFSIPDSLFQFSHNVVIKIQFGDNVITNQVVHLSQSTPKNELVNGTENTKNSHPKLLKKQEWILNDQLRYLKSISGIIDDTFSLTPENLAFKAEESLGNSGESIKEDFKKFWNQYGWERLSFPLSDSSSLSKDEELIMQGNKIPRSSRFMHDLPDMDSANRMNSFLVQEAGRHRNFSACRSLSLPSNLLPTSDVRNSLGGYLEMGGKEPLEIKPHERLLMNLQSYRHLEREESDEAETAHMDLMNSISSDQYMTLRMSHDEEINTRALLKKGLSSSQQELLDLMQDYKEGEYTMSYVEEQFHLWQERHCPRTREAAKRSRKTSALAMLWKRTKKKELQVVIGNKETVKPNADGKQEEKISSRKISSTSASSGSSKTSEKSLLPASQRDESTGSEQKSDDGTAPTGWVSSYSPTANRVFIPRYPRAEPPPLPSRPPPWSKMNTINKPTPPPRKILPNSANDAADVIEEEKNSDLFEDSDECEDEERNSSMYNLCQKYGLEKLGVCVASRGNGYQDNGENLDREEMTNTNINRSLQRRIVDSEGYEIPIKKKLKSLKSISTHASMRRSFSLPSNLNHSYELPDDLLDSPEAEMPHNSENHQNTWICDHCDEYQDSFTNNFYMSLLEFHRDNSADEASTIEQSFLSKSQQELLDLMYAFKSGDKTISQVEQQFAEWHSRHMGNCPHSSLRPNNKLPKQSSFGLPSFMKILGIQKKKTTNENKFEYNLEKGDVKNSEAAATDQKHLSKLSNTSSSSANSELSEVSKTTIESLKSPEPTADLKPPICPKRPPPVPPKRPLPIHEHSKMSQMLQTHTLPGLKTQMTLQNAVKKEKPIPPPKPKFRLKLSSNGSSLSESSHPTVEENKKIEDSSQDVEDESSIRPSSPDYIVPNTHSRPGRPKLQRQLREIDYNQKLSTLPNHQPYLANSAALRSRKITEPSGPELSAQTLELLKRANLFNPDRTKPMFYVRRSSSDPNLRLSERTELKKKHIYLEILPPMEGDLPNQSIPVNGNTSVS